VADDTNTCGDPTGCVTTRCQGGDCLYEVKSCDDGNECTDDFCRQSTGACESVADDSNACGAVEDCLTTWCQAGYCQWEWMSCDDAVDCTGDLCIEDGQGGHCWHEDLCSFGDDDGDPCTQGSCNYTTGSCQHAPVNCDLNPDDCIARTCDPGTGQCVLQPTDGLPCASAACDDGDPCTTDSGTCQQGQCGDWGGSCFHALDCSGDTCEVRDVRVAADKTTISWSPLTLTCGATQHSGEGYQVAVGSLASTPGGEGGAESCLDAGTATSMEDVAFPDAGEGWWYVVRALLGGSLRGTWGFAGVRGERGPERHTPVCP